MYIESLPAARTSGVLLTAFLKHMRTTLLLLHYYGWVYLLFLTRMSIAERNISINP